MKIHNLGRKLFMCGALTLGLFVTTSRSNAYAEVISGTITNWPESGPIMPIGDGVNDVHAWWSLNTTDKGWLYGSLFTGDSDVAHALGVTDISQISDASILSFTNDIIGPLCDANCDPDGVGEFVVWRNQQGFYGVLRIDDIFFQDGQWLLNGTWWFQTDGTPDFASAICDIQFSQASFANGEPVIAQIFRFANVSGASLAIEFKVWLEVPGVTAPISFVRGGADGSVVLPPGFDVNRGPFTLFTVTPQFPRGSYGFSCRFVNPVTGKLQTEDLNSFVVQ